MKWIREPPVYWDTNEGFVFGFILIFIYISYTGCGLWSMVHGLNLSPVESAPTKATAYCKLIKHKPGCVPFLLHKNEQPHKCHCTEGPVIYTYTNLLLCEAQIIFFNHQRCVNLQWNPYCKYCIWYLWGHASRYIRQLQGLSHSFEAWTIYIHSNHNRDQNTTSH